MKKNLLSILRDTSIWAVGAGVAWFLYQGQVATDKTLAVQETKLELVADKLIVPEHIQKAEEEYWHFFRTEHKGIALGPVKAGERLYAKWWIPRRPTCGEVQFFIILNEGKNYVATVFSNVTIPQTNKFYGKTRDRYRSDARDRRVSVFTSVEGLSIPKTLKPGTYYIAYTYYFILCQSEYPSTLDGLVQPDDLVKFEVI